MSKNIFLVLILSFFMLASCHEEVNYVDEGFEIYMSRFEAEAKARNINIDFEKKPVIARFEVHQNEVALGWCNYDLDAQNMITINLVFWNILDELGKEKLIFHELGHCTLYRSHLDRKRANGVCYSIMHSGQACSDNYSPETREAYLDELFLR